MKNILRVFILILFCFVICLSFLACDSNDNSVNTDSGSSVNTDSGNSGTGQRGSQEVILPYYEFD